MTEDKDTFQQKPLPWRRSRSQESCLALCVAWSLDEPARVGEVTLVTEDDDGWQLGRGQQQGDDARRLRFVRQRPGTMEHTPPLAAGAISRHQLTVRAMGDVLAVDNVGRCPMIINGQPAQSGELRVGDTVFLTNQLLLLCVRVPSVMPMPRGWSQEAHPFGTPDAQDVVGESSVSWSMRGDMAFAAMSDSHVLIAGDSGTGKELAARAIHRLSTRGNRPFLSRSAATFPAGLVDAELFGNVKNFPNPGMVERRGLIAEADGSTLFLDEIGEMPSELQAHLLRVLDAGEYQRLGETATRRSDFRLVAATNRDPAELKHDLAARLTMRLTMPPLRARRQDLPLLVNHLLRTMHGQTPDLVERFFEADQTPRIDPLLVDHLLRRSYPLNVRDLKRLLWDAIKQSEGDFIEMHAGLTPGAQASESLPPSDDSAEPDAAQVETALQEHAGNITKAASALGLPNRYALYRLIKRYELEGALRDASREPSAEAIQQALARAGGSVSKAAALLGVKNRYSLYRLLKKHGLDS